ncbi:hypothetical protein [Ligilactobacillus equi]|uniref:Uncharacterized protein n=1 Tax=Ligilactobacillus equi DPC 6820 TaxID=1392007 RepID=V7I0T8_9LACO|nr:hypothetical protein [Ligilactobacillus equi]ETA75073.1 hypothetical protein LEQ_1420 [Ligilactobacillus equi DPC 6820]
MFNSEYRKEAEDRLKGKVDTYNQTLDSVKVSIEYLYDMRESSNRSIELAMDVLNSYRNVPETLKIQLERIELLYQNYTNLKQEAEEQYKKDYAQVGGTVAAGALAGAGVTALAPSVAMAFATTFGTASTGTAISALTGAAATNAALAWLGGGAVAAGGGGMIAGEALLGLAGPIGWVIGGAALVGGGLLANSKNKEAAETANKRAAKVEREIKKLVNKDYEIRNQAELTRADSDGLLELVFDEDYSSWPEDFQELSNEQKYKLGTLRNATLAAAENINTILDKNGKFKKVSLG